MGYDNVIAGELILLGMCLRIEDKDGQKIAYAVRQTEPNETFTIDGVAENNAKAGEKVEVLGWSPYLHYFVENHDFEKNPEMTIA